MRRRSVAILTGLIVSSMAVFVFAPIVYSPIQIAGGPICFQSKNGLCPESAYESASCAVFGAGMAYDWSYHVGCPPPEIFTNLPFPVS